MSARSTPCSLLACALAVALGCSSLKDAGTNDIRRPLLRGLGSEVFVPTYVEFELALDELDIAVERLCEEPSPAALEHAQQAWWAARAPWKRNDLLAFGPYAEPPLRAGPKIDFWPARSEAIENLLGSDLELSAELLDGRGAAERGLPVIEYLLYVVEPTPQSDVTMAFSPSSRRCEYLLALTADVAAQAAALRAAWDPEQGNYLAELVDAGRGRQFATIELALGEVVSRLAFVVENVRNEKLGVPLGNRSAGTPQPNSAESRFSGRSLEDARDNLRGVDAVIFGTGDERATSIAAYLNDIREETLVSDLRAALDAGYARLDAIDEPLTDSVYVRAEVIQAAIDELAQLQRLIQVDTIHAMGITLTFNDSDGD